MRQFHKIFITLFFLFTFHFCLTAVEPRLIVIALVDGMSENAMTEMQDYWQVGGLRTLVEEAYHTTLHYDCIVYGGIETTATLMTGVEPTQHGIISTERYQRHSRSVEHSLNDKEYKGIGTNTTMSLRTLKTMTIADEMRARYGDATNIYAVGLSEDNTMLLAGHSADACCWLDEHTLHWVSSTYYPEGLPSEADEMNISGVISDMAAKEWSQSLNINSYLFPTFQEQRQGFSYSQKKYLKQTPICNQLVTDLALRIQKEKRLGMFRHPDLLMLEYTVQTPKSLSDNLLSAEQEEMYMQLNRHLGYLMEQLNQRIGKDKYQLIVVGKPNKGQSTEQFKRANIDITYFDVNRAAALLNTYLMAIYGHERWIDGGYGHSIYLNRTLLEQKGMSISAMQRQVADFLLEFDGVADAYPTTEVPMLVGDGKQKELRNSCNKHQVGDVMFILENNCILTYGDDKPIDHVIDSDPQSPLFIWTGTRTPHPQATDYNATDLKGLIIKN